MKPIDYRNETWEQVRARGLEGLRDEVYRAYLRHGPCTTEELAARLARELKPGDHFISLFTVRPRTTELFQLGYVELAYPDLPARAGVYQAVPDAVAAARFELKKAEALQLQLPLI